MSQPQSPRKSLVSSAEKSATFWSRYKTEVDRSPILRYSDFAAQMKAADSDRTENCLFEKTNIIKIELHLPKCDSDCSSPPEIIKNTKFLMPPQLKSI